MHLTQDVTSDDITAVYSKVATEALETLETFESWRALRRWAMVPTWKQANIDELDFQQSF